ncbi:MAG: hypothetical protein KF802_13415 [Bdellovibrionaceae bacterium]|nr:hypothetical protein [Pseudobdellovibrionaceae bacterium]
MKQRIHQNQLQSHLKKFGLNPTDWVLSAVSRQTYLITHREDRDFSFIGRTRGRQVKSWSSLALNSI